MCQLSYQIVGSFFLFLFLIIILVIILNATTWIPLKYMSVWSNNYIGASYSHIYGVIYYKYKKKEAPFYFSQNTKKISNCLGGEYQYSLI